MMIFFKAIFLLPTFCNCQNIVIHWTCQHVRHWDVDIFLEPKSSIRIFCNLANGNHGDYREEI